MAKQELVETIFGKRHKYEIIREPGWTTKFYIYKDGAKHGGWFDDLRVAVKKAKEEAEKA